MFRSYGFWTALAGLLTIFIGALGKVFGFAVEDDIVTDIVMGIAGVLVLFGVVSLPKQDDEGGDPLEGGENEKGDQEQDQNDDKPQNDELAAKKDDAEDQQK